MSLSSKIITTSSHPQNRNSSDWGWQGLIAYGSHHFVVVVHPTSSQVVQVLNKHNKNVVCVKWKPQNVHHDVVNPYSLTLASGDTNGNVILWNVTKGEFKSEFHEKGRAVRDMVWMTNRETGEASILVLYTGNVVITWDSLTSTQLWKTSFPESLASVCIDPFNNEHAAFLCDDSSLLFMQDLQTKTAPSGKYKKFSFQKSIEGAGLQAKEDTKLRRNSSSGLNKFLNMTTSFIVGDTKSSRKSISEEDSQLQQCLHLTFHPGLRHVVLMVYPTRVDMVDTDVSMIISTVRLDSKSSCFVRVWPCKQKDVLFCLHENTCITVRVRREDSSHCSFNENQQTPSPITPESPGLEVSSKSDIAYDLIWQSDPLRISNQSTVFGFVLNPVYENSAALVFSDGKVVVWELVKTQDGIDHISHQSNINGETTEISLDCEKNRMDGEFRVIVHEKISHFISRSKGTVPPFEVNTDKQEIALVDILPSLSRRGQRNIITEGIRFLLTGMVRGSPWSVSTIKSNLIDQVSIANDPGMKSNEYLLAIGTDNGNINIMDMKSGQILKDFTIHFDAVKGIQWVNQKIILSWSSCKSGGSNQNGRNELFLTWLNSGKVEAFRQRLGVESIITSVKISPLRQYVVIAFKSQPLEIWSLQSRTLLREMPANFLQPRAITWSPTCSWRTVKRQISKQSREILNESRNIQNMSKIEISNLLQNIESKKVAKEECVLADRDGTICRITLEERTITDIIIYPPEVNGMSSLTHIAMKDDMLMLADSSGMMCLWNLVEKRLKSVPRSGDKPYTGLKKILFHPHSKDYRFAVIHEHGVDVWLFSQDKVKLLGSIKNGKTNRKALSVEWADLNHIVVLMEEGSIQIIDPVSGKSTSSWNDRNMVDPVFCPHILPIKGSLIIKHILQNLTNANDLKNHLQYLDEYTDIQHVVTSHLSLLSRDVIESICTSKLGIAERCLKTARLLGDEFDVQFWTLALHFLKLAKHQQDNPSEEPMLLSFKDSVSTSNSRTTSMADHICAETYVDCLRQQTCFSKHQIHRVIQQDKKRVTEEHRIQCIETFQMMGRIEDAVRLLLETDFSSGCYKEDYLRACLLSCDRGNTTAQSTLKLVATHLIISGKLQEGVVVLCLMDKVLDACKYLQSYGEWEKAAWLAKLMLSTEECKEVYSKWIEHLTQSKQMMAGTMIMMSQMRFDDVYKTLDYIGYVDIAACFIQACKEFNISVAKAEDDQSSTEIIRKYRAHIERLGLRVS